MRSLLFITVFCLSVQSRAQFNVGIKIGGLAFHQQKVEPNYYRWSLDKKGRWVGYLSISFSVGYRFSPYLGVKLIQTVLPYDCAGKFSGITHLGINFFDDIIGLKNERHELSASFGPLFYYRKNWKAVSNYYVDEGFMKTGRNKDWERKFVWYGGQIQYDYYWAPGKAISTSFLPGYPYIYTFNTGVQVEI